MDISSFFGLNIPGDVKKTSPKKVPFMDWEVAQLANDDEPDKVSLSYKRDRDTTKVQFFDEDGECYFEKSVPGDKREEYKDLVYRYTRKIPEEQIVSTEIIKGGGKGRPSCVKSIYSLDRETRALVGKTLVRMQNESKAGRVYLDEPIPIEPVWQPNGGERIPKSDKMSMGTFLCQIIDTDIDLDRIFENLNCATDEYFSIDNIEEVLVGDGGTTLAFRTKEGVKAFMNFKNGTRQISKPDPDGPCLLLSDENGPLLRRKNKHRDKTLL